MSVSTPPCADCHFSLVSALDERSSDLCVACRLVVVISEAPSGRGVQRVWQHVVLTERRQVCLGVAVGNAAQRSIEVVLTDWEGR